MTGPATLALTMIVRDGARSIVRALTSAAPYVDRMVVVDTGSTDGTQELARECGAQVHHFAWVDDFSAARNHALDLADADWSLVLDSDEWISSGGEALSGLREDRRRYVGTVRCENIEDVSTGEVSYALQTVRLLPVGIRYRYRVHEQPWHDLKAWASPVVISHDGYDKNVLGAKAGRNRGLLEKQLAETPGHPYYSFKYGEELRNAKEFEAALPHFWCGYRGGRPGVPWRHGLVLGLIGCLADAGHFEEALAVVEEEMPRWQESPDFFFVLGNVLLDYGLARPELGAVYLPLIEDAYVRCLEIGDRPDLDNSMIGHGSFLAAHNLYAYHDSLGHTEKAAVAAALEAELRAAGGAVRHRLECVDSPTIGAS